MFAFIMSVYLKVAINRTPDITTPIKHCSSQSHLRIFTSFFLARPENCRRFPVVNTESSQHAPDYSLQNTTQSKVQIKEHKVRKTGI